MRKQNGFTLIEIAIVLVIIGLLLGGVLKGQELITAARVRNLAAQLDGVKIAYLGFQDRYRSLPGDYAIAQAAANIPGAGGVTTLGCTAAGTCGNGKIDDANEGESIIAWHQLSRSGFITGNYDGTGTTPTATNNPTNAFSGYLQLINDAAYLDPAATVPVALTVKTGSNVPSPILAELDRKIDDGFPNTGSLRFSVWQGSTAASCINAGPPIVYNAANDIKTCGAAQLQ
jgi:prepilin-type N-terminal cleavage/methylation domain-containing protein